MASDVEKISQAAHTTEQLLAGDDNVLDQLLVMFGKGLNLPIIYWQLACIIAAAGLGLLITLYLRHLFRKKDLLRAVDEAINTTSDPSKAPHVDENSPEENLKRQRYPISKLLLQLSWALLTMGFLFSFCLLARVANLLPEKSLPLESIAWLICEAYVVIRIVVFIIQRSIKGLRLSNSLENLMVFMIWSLVALQIVGVLPKFLNFLEETKIPLGRESISLWTCGMAIFTIAVALLVAKWISSLLEKWIWSLPKMQSNVRVVLIRIMKIVLVFIAILIGLSSVGIDITVLGVFGGAIGVGLGFGLQKIASNYVSGFIILMDRSVKIGDMVSVAGIEGIVQDIKTRYTVIRQFNGSVTILPNESFVVSNVTNSSYLAGPGRSSVSISVDYSSDVEEVIKLMTSIVADQPRVLTNPAPYTLLANFGADGIDLTSYFWVADPENGTALLRSNISRAFLREFNKRGISIPFAQRDLRILGMPEIVCKVETQTLKPEASVSGVSLKSEKVKS